MKRLISLFVLIAVLCLMMTSCGSGNAGGSDTSDSDSSPASSEVESTSVSSQVVVSDGELLSKEQAIAILTEEGKIWHVEGFILHAVKFTLEGDTLHYLEYDEGRKHEGTVVFSDDGVEMTFTGNNGVAPTPDTGCYYQRGSQDAAQYNSWRLTEDHLYIGTNEWWEKASEDTSVFN